jgi:uncharacterized membrane protein YedE/YeeE
MFSRSNAIGGLIALTLVLNVFTSSGANAQLSVDASVAVSEHQYHSSLARIAVPLRSSPSVVHREVWPWFALGGALLAGAATWTVVSQNCEQGCRDDGGQQRGFYWTVAATGIGAVVGGLVGSLVDASRDAPQ